MKYLFEGNYSIYMEVTFCDSKGDVRKGIDRIDVISDVVIDKVLSKKEGFKPLFLIQRNIKFDTVQLYLIHACIASVPTAAYINQTEINCTTI